MRGNRWVALIEVAAFYSLALAVIWGGEGRRPTLLVLAALAVALCVFSNRWHKDSAARLGLTANQFFPALKRLAIVAVPLAIPLYAMAAMKGFQGDWNLWFSVLGYPVWGFAQQYVLLAFMANRLEEGFSSDGKSRNISVRLVPWVNGFLFAAIHYPNPILMTATAIAGVLFTSVFLRHRNLYAPALIHALFGVGLSFAFGDIYGSMTVGPGYFYRVGIF